MEKGDVSLFVHEGYSKDDIPRMENHFNTQLKVHA